MKNEIIVQPPRLSIVARKFLQFAIIVSILATLSGILAVLKIPTALVALIVLLIPAALFTLWIIIKFFRDNFKLLKSFGFIKICLIFIQSFIAFIPILIILLPGLYFGSVVTRWTNLGIEKLQVWSAPNVFLDESSTEVITPVETKVKIERTWTEEVKSWFWDAPDYKTIVENEVKIVTEQLKRIEPQPWHIRVVAESLKTILSCISIYTLAWLVLLIVRSYIRLFGRVLVSYNPMPFEMHSHTETRLSDYNFNPNTQVEFANQLSISHSSNDALYIKRTDEPNNAVPSIKFLLRRGALLTRLMNKLFLMSEATSTSENSKLTFQGQGNEYYTSVQLEAGQVVVVEPKKLIGYSDSIRFHSYFNFNLALLSMQRGISMLAKGPGRLVLKSQGPPILYDSVANAEKLYMDKLMLFGMDSKFKLHASKGFLNYYMSGCVVKPEKGQFFICSPENPPKIGFARSIWNLMKQAYMPI